MYKLSLKKLIVFPSFPSFPLSLFSLFFLNPNRTHLSPYSYLWSSPERSMHPSLPQTGRTRHHRSLVVRNMGGCGGSGRSSTSGLSGDRVGLFCVWFLLVLAWRTRS